ncbi:MAG: phospho-N-acetylmuramoyl-pentapeptide-transferase, partial [Clostridia bacterium]|nr:phospho-N-acetylmuramoyl-pentapeptide-transferase [Clostridia bacterium]
MAFLKSINGIILMLIAAAISLVITIVAGKLLIPALIRLKAGQTERDDGPESHLSKTGTPTMGGIMMLAGILVTCIVLTAGKAEFMITSLLVTFAYGLIGFLDDYIKVVKK